MADITKEVIEDAHLAGLTHYIEQHGEFTKRLAKFAALQRQREASAVPEDVRLVPKTLLIEIEGTLLYYANECTYQGQRTGGVLKGCPRGPKPMSNELVRYARKTLDKFNKMLSAAPTPAEKG